MAKQTLFSIDSAVALRQPKTDRLILARFLKDAAFFHLYGLPCNDVEYILSTFKGIDDQRPLFLGGSSIAQRIVRKYAEMSFPV